RSASNERAGRRSRPAERAGRAPAPRLAAATPPPAFARLGQAAATFSAGAAPTSRATRRSAREDGRRDASTAGSPLTRTVVRVLEVVPTRLRIALAALVGLGLLLGAATVVQTVRRRRLERQRRRLIADVGVLQSALLPEIPEHIGGARVTAAYRPAEGLAAGGDFYDAFELPGGRTAVLVGDISGHGRDVVPLTALARYNLRAYLEAGLTPRATLHVAANVLAPHIGDRQVTIAAAIFDPGMGRLTYACAGHGPPLLLGTDATPVTACSSPPIGAGAPTGRRQTTIALAPGATACFHTDGLDEVPVASGRLGREGVAEELRAVGPEGDSAELLARIVRRSEHQPDDMAACIITALPGGADRWCLRLEELEVDAETLNSGWAERFLLACGVGRPHLGTALLEAREIVARDGTAVIEVRVGEALAEVRVAAPPAVMLPIERRPAGSSAAAEAG
ncbi:MAG: Serine phosphatase RsbU, regulator of sigma subunit, partial [uncultured Solirubrobacteraceae bacterium]